MPRNYANVFTAIWSRDGDFVKLSSEAQRVYMMLFTQGEISACGLLPLRRRRWVTNSSDGSESALNLALKELEEHRYLVLDEDTEEVLVRSFTNHDNGYANPRRLPSIRDAAAAVESPKLLRVLAEEFERLGVPAKWRSKASTDWLSVGNSGTSEGPSADPENSTRMHDARHGAYQNSSVDGEALFDANALGNGYAVANDVSTECLTDSRRRVPQPTTHNPSLKRRAAADAADAQHATVQKPPTDTQRSKVITDAYAAVEPMCRWPAINAVVLKAVKAGKWTDDAIRTAVLRLATDGRSVTVETLRVELGGPPRASGRGSFQPYRNPDSPDAYAGYEMKGGPDAA